MMANDLIPEHGGGVIDSAPKQAARVREAAAFAVAVAQVSTPVVDEVPPPPFHEAVGAPLPPATTKPSGGHGDREPPPTPSPKGLKRNAVEAFEASTPGNTAAAPEAVAKKKRLCRYPGCTKVIKSQGHCQRHGARAKRCKVEGCEKQAQGTHDGMCKRHWKAANFPEETSKKVSTPPEPEGESVYDSVLPMSIAYRPVQKPAGAEESADYKPDLLVDPPAAPKNFQVMPLVAYLKEGTLSQKQAGWHRNAERRARGMFPVKGLSVQLEPWEKQLALIETLLLSGGTPYANFKELAFAWGREKGFHHVLSNSVCERRGEVERKKRSDAGKSMTDEEKLAFRSKLQKARDKNGTSKEARKIGPGVEDFKEEDKTKATTRILANDHGKAVAVYLEPPPPADVPVQVHDQMTGQGRAVEARTNTVVALPKSVY